MQFGALQVTARVCYTRPPTEPTNTDAFVEVDEVTLQGEVKRIFTGWMFAASPGLHAVEHPIYDVWLTDCAATQAPVAQPVLPPAPAPAAGTANAPPGQPRVRQAAPRQRVAPPATAAAPPVAPVRRRPAGTAQPPRPRARRNRRTAGRFRPRSARVSARIESCLEAIRRGEASEHFAARDRAIHRERAEVSVADQRGIEQR